MPDEVAYQQAGQIQQLLAERENAEAYGQTDRVAAIDKQLAGFGVKPKADRAEAAKERKAAAGGEEDARAKPPEGRASRAQTTTEGGKKS